MTGLNNIRAIVTDIEGTTSSISFVKDVLFPYARKHMEHYVRQNEKKVTAILDEVRRLENNQSLSSSDIIKILLRWMDEDLKITPLKTLQGIIWQAGYEAGDLEGHMYDDATAHLRAWHKKGLKIYIYSSGSIAAQKLLFSHTREGDLTPLFSGYFDTTTGPKLEAGSYQKIAATIGVPPREIVFLSDHAGEIEAAAKAGFDTVLVDREKISAPRKFKTVHSFDEISLNQEKAA